MGDQEMHEEFNSAPFMDVFPAFVTTSGTDVLTPVFQRFFDNKENVDPLSRFAAGEEDGSDDHGNDDGDDKKPSFSGRKHSKVQGLKFGLGSCTRKSKSPLPDNYPRVPFQDITAVIDPDNEIFRAEQGDDGVPSGTPGPNPEVALSSKGKRKAAPIQIDLVVEERQRSVKRQLRRLNPTSRSDVKNVRNFR